MLWLIINSSTALPIAATGAVISLVIAWIFARRSNVWQIDISPRGAWHFGAYTVTFFIELVKANINMLRYVYSPRIDIRPGIVKVHMRLKSPIGRLALANSIALTPGSLVMDVRGDAMFIHWLDVKTTDPDEATEMIAGAIRKASGGGLWLTIILQIAGVLIFFSIVFGVLRLIIGRTIIDRVVAIDMLTVVSISLIALYAHMSGRFVYLDVALVYGLLSFLAVLAIARFLEKGP